MRVSVIIPTYNGQHKIGNVLAAVMGQTVRCWEIIVVIDGSTDKTEEVAEKLLAEWGEASGRAWKVIVQPNGGRAVARNRGAKEASGELLMFFDDDMRPEAACVNAHIRHHQHVQNSIAVGMQVEDRRVMKTDIQQYKAGLSRKWMEPLKANNGFLNAKQPFITAANFSVSRELFFQLGGFDERLTDAEDYDLAVRAVLQQIPIYFKAEAVAWHDDFITCQSYVKRLRQYQTAHRQLRALKPDIYAQVDHYIHNAPSRTKRLVYNCLARKKTVRAIDGGSLKWLPVRVRYKLYDIVTTGLSVHFPERIL